MLFRLIVSTIASVGIIALLLFVPAGTLNWPRAWVTIGIFLIGSVVTVVDLLRVSPALLNERLKSPFQKGQPVSDKIVLVVLVVGFYCMIAFTALDVFRLHIIRMPPIWVSVVGLVLFLIGWGLAYIALRQNAFAAAVVKYQEERQQTVVDTGLYSVIRHPIYAGGALFIIGFPLWLGSYAGALVAFLPIAALFVRIFIEEGLLRRQLPGYADYAKRVHYRLIPFIW